MKVNITVKAQKEDYTPEHAEQVHGYCEGFAEAVRANMLEHSTLWGWCVVSVTASYKGQEEAAYLGGCSYESRKDFIMNSGYYQDMVIEAVERLLERPYWDQRDKDTLRAVQAAEKASSALQVAAWQAEREAVK